MKFADEETARELNNAELDKVSGGIASAQPESIKDVIYLKQKKCPKCQKALSRFNTENGRITGTCIRCNIIWDYRF